MPQVAEELKFCANTLVCAGGGTLTTSGAFPSAVLEKKNHLLGSVQLKRHYCTETRDLF